MSSRAGSDLYNNHSLGMEQPTILGRINSNVNWSLQVGGVNQPLGFDVNVPSGPTSFLGVLLISSLAAHKVCAVRVLPAACVTVTDLDVTSQLTFATPGTVSSFAVIERTQPPHISPTVMTVVVGFGLAEKASTESAKHMVTSTV